MLLNCLIENPAFESQSKELLTSQPSSFGSKPAIPPSFVEELDGVTGIVEAVIGDLLSRKSSSVASRRTKSMNKEGLEKLEDAEWAGSSKAGDCTLIVTEVPNRILFENVRATRQKLSQWLVSPSSAGSASVSSRSEENF